MDSAILLATIACSLQHNKSFTQNIVFLPEQLYVGSHGLLMFGTVTYSSAHTVLCAMNNAFADLHVPTYVGLCYEQLHLLT